MNIRKFQEWVSKEWSRNPRPNDLAIMTLGLCGETGEVSEPIKKHLRGDGLVNVDELALELGDVLHYLTAIAFYFDLDMEEIAEANVSKLVARKAAKLRST